MTTMESRYVPGTGRVRVTLTRELPMRPHEHYPHFIGELDGTPIRYHCLAVEYVVAIRRGLAECGAVLHDAASSWLDLWTVTDDPPVPEPLPTAASIAADLARLRNAVKTGKVGGDADGAPRRRQRKA